MGEYTFPNKEKWQKEKFQFQGKYRPEETAYYKRSFGTYAAHVFIIVIHEEDELKQGWQSVDNQIAFYVQSETEKLIEKSNFYICYFLDKEVTLSLKRQIETDDFCAKKYIYDNMDPAITEEERCAYVENQLFSIQTVEKSDPKPKIKEIKVQNFRAFEGEKAFPFTCESDREKAADLVVIYAPNGTGKTSLLDSFEYTLHGSVARLADSVSIQKDKGNYKEPVYHNIRHKTEEAYTQFTVEKLGTAKRKVTKYSEDKGDLDVNSSVSGETKTIIGKAEDKETWDTFLLTHEVLDAFLSDTSPKEKYDLWVKKNSLLKTEHKAFSSAASDYRKAMLELEKCENKLEATRTEQEELKKKEGNLKVLRKMISQYNKLSEDPLQMIADGSASEEYHTLMTKVRGEKKDLKEKIRSTKGILQKAVSMQEMGVDVVFDGLAELTKLDENVTQQQTRVENISLYQSKKESRDALDNSLKDLQLKAAVYKKLLDKWKEAKRGSQLLHLLEANIEKLQKDIAEIRKNWNKEEGNLSSVQKELENLCSAVRFEEEATKRVERISVLEKETDSLRKELDQIAYQIKELEAKEADRKKVLSWYRECVLPGQISDDTYRIALKYENVLSKQQLSALYTICENYGKVTSSIQFLSQTGEDIRQKVVRSLYEGAGEFAKWYPDYSRCPVCDHDHGTSEALKRQFSQAILRLSQVNEETRAEFDRALKECESLYEDWRNVVSAGIEDRSAALEEEVNALQTSLTEDNEKQKALERSIMDRIGQTEAERKMLLSYGITGSLTREDVAQFYQKQRKLLSGCENKQNSIREKCRRYESKLEELQEQLSAYEVQLSDIKEAEDSDLILLGDEDTFDSRKVKKKYQALVLEIDAAVIQMDELEAGMSEVQEYCFADLAAEQAKLDTMKLSQKQQKRTFKEFLDYGSFTREELHALKDQTEAKLAVLDQRQTLLNSIQDENQARDYIARYKELQDKESDLIQAVADAAQLRNEKKTAYDEKSAVLVKKLEDVHNSRLANEIFQKINPNLTMREFEYELSFSEDKVPKPELTIWALDENRNRFKPEYYFSTAQLNTIVFSIYMARALETNNMTLKTIMVDDPVGHFDDINILSFADLLRILTTTFHCQIVLTTFDMKVFNILQRKLEPKHYPSSFLRLEKLK